MKFFKKIILFILSINFFCFSANSQEKWDLEKCLDYALEKNIRVKQQKLTLEYFKNQEKQARYGLAPSVNASVGQHFAFGRSKNVITNQYNEMNSTNTSFALSADVMLFNGFAQHNKIKKSEYDREVSVKDLEKTQNDISIAIMSAYLDILFNKELLNIALNYLKISELQLEYEKKQVEAGNKPEGVLFETEAQKANEELNVTSYQNKLHLSLLNLAQMLELESVADFDVLAPNINISEMDKNLVDANAVFEQTVADRPEIQSKELKLKSMEKSTAIAKAQLYPSLSLGAYYNNDYQGFEGNSRSFSEQVKNNGKEGVGFTLRIPLFNGFSARTSVSNSKINYENTKYELQLEKNNLLKEIQQVHANAVAAMQKYYSAKKALNSNKEAFRYVEEKFKLGVIASLEYNNIKNKMIIAESTLIQAKYEYLFRVKILDFYNGKQLRL